MKEKVDFYKRVVRSVEREEEELKELKKRCPSVRCEHVFYNSDAHNLEAINEPVNQINKDDFYQLWRKI